MVSTIADLVILFMYFGGVVGAGINFYLEVAEGEAERDYHNYIAMGCLTIIWPVCMGYILYKGTS